MTSPSTKEQIDDLRRAVTSSREALLGGTIVQFAGLDTEVARVSTLAENALIERRDDVLFAMVALLYEIDGLAADLRRQQGAAILQRAASAYSADQGAH
jgi:hypothetical protein